MNIKPVQHIPVMESEIVELLRQEKHGITLVDCTLGYGGHSYGLTRGFTQDDCLIGIDRDDDAISFCRTLFTDHPFQTRFHQCGFEQLDDVFVAEGIAGADLFLFDCGFSSPQVDHPERGFSFMRDGPLDMRMDQRHPFRAADLIQTWSEQELGKIFRDYGDERFARKIAKAIVRRRRDEPIETTQELADLILMAIPERYRHQEGIHPATRVFQALRIVVNQELESLRTGLGSALEHLQPQGRIAVLSYHSLEHRIVKELFRDYCGRCICPPGLPQCGCGALSRGFIVTKKPVKPCAAERERNSRCRSAQLRVLERFQESVDPK